MRKFYLVLSILSSFLAITLDAQVNSSMAVRGTINSFGETAMTYRGGSLNTWMTTIQATTSNAGGGFLFSPIGASFNPKWARGAAVSLNTKTTWFANGGDGTYNQANGSYYTFIIRDVAGGTDTEGYLFETSATPVSVSTVTQTPNSTNVSPGDAVIVTATTSGNLPMGQGVFLRYSTSVSFATSTVVNMTGSGTSYSATIPSGVNIIGVPVYYYVFTSGGTTPPAAADCDLASINLNNNGGSNYSYTPGRLWTNPITGTNPNTANPYITGQAFNSNVTVSGIGRGSGIAGTNANNRYNAIGWSTGPIDLDDYFEFTLTPNSGYKIDFASFVYNGQVSAGSPTFQFRSSLDGFASNIGTPLVTNTTINLSGPSYQSISGPITFRFYGYGFATAGTTYSINDFTFYGAVSIICTQPTISTNPSDQTACTNTGVTFNSASSTSGATYQWEMSANGTTGWTNVVDGTPTGATYTNATTNILGVTSTAGITQYYYRSKVTASGCNAYTTAAKLIVNAPVVIDASYPSNSSVSAPFGTSFSVAAGITGTATTYFWEYSDDGGTTWQPATGGVYSGSTTATLSISNTTGLTGTRYRNTVTGPCNTAVSSLILNVPPDAGAPQA